MRREPFGTTPSGELVERFTLIGRDGLTLQAISHGATITSIRVPDAGGALHEVTLGYDTLAGYVGDTHYIGALVGRSANRIAQSRFVLDGTEVRLTPNRAPHHLHGGARGFDKVTWRAEPFATAVAEGVTFRHRSPAGDEGYPGTLDVAVTYSITMDGELRIDCEAKCDAPTPVNLAQHAYFDLSGRGDLRSQQLMIASDEYTPVTPDLIPTGEIAPVDGTPFDLRTPTRLGARIDLDEPQLRAAGGFDHNFVVRRASPGLALAARLVDPASGRSLEVHTTAPGVQLYTGNFLGDGAKGRGGKPFVRHSALCLETQGFPDAPNQPAFPSTIVRPGTPYRSRTVWVFDGGE